MITDREAQPDGPLHRAMLIRLWQLWRRLQPAGRPLGSPKSNHGAVGAAWRLRSPCGWGKALQSLFHGPQDALDGGEELRLDFVELLGTDFATPVHDKAERHRR